MILKNIFNNSNANSNTNIIQTTHDALAITPTNNSNIFGVHINADLESTSSKTFGLIALFEAKRYTSMCIEAVPMCSMCLATCVEVQGEAAFHCCVLSVKTP